MHFWWSEKREENGQLVRASLYMNWMNDAEYDESDESLPVLLGSVYREQNGAKFKALVAYSMAPKTSRSRYYKDQSDTRILPGDWDTIDEARAAVESYAALFFEKLGRQIVAAER